MTAEQLAKVIQDHTWTQASLRLAAALEADAPVPAPGRAVRRAPGRRTPLATRPRPGSSPTTPGRTE